MDTTKTMEEAIREQDARKANGPWYPAANGTETPFQTRSGAVLQYMYQPSTGRHAYFDTATDMPLTDAEAEALMEPRK